MANRNCFNLAPQHLSTGVHEASQGKTLTWPGLQGCGELAAHAHTHALPHSCRRTSHTSALSEGLCAFREADSLMRLGRI